MKFYWLALGVLMVTMMSCRSGFLPAGPYTITETHRECKDDKCKPVTIILAERDCGGWDPEVPYGWEQCDPKTIARK